MIKRTLLLLIYACFFLVYPARAQQKNDAFAEEGKQIKLIIAKPVDATTIRIGRDGWFGGLAEQLLYFRLGASDQFSIVSPAKVHSYMSRQEGRNVSISSSTYETLARQIGATHILLQNYEIARDGREVYYYAELRALDGKSGVAPYEKSFPVELVGQHIDSCVVWLYGTVGAKIDRELERFFSLDVLSEGKDNRSLGNYAVAAVSSDTKQAKGIVPELTRIIDRDPRNIFAQYLAAQALETAQEHLRAANVIKDLIMVLPNYNNLYVKACRNFRLAGKNQQALSYAADAEGRGVHSLDLMIEGGLALEALKKHQRASNVFKNVMAQYPDNMEAILFFARYYNHQNNGEKAIEFTDKILKDSPQNGQALLQKGIALAGQKKFKEAVDVLKRAQQALSWEPEVSQILGDVYTSLKMHKPAARAYAQVLEFKPNDFQMHLDVGRAWMKADEPAEALSAFLRSRQMFADSIILHKEIGLLSAQMGDTADAVTHLERYIEKKQSDPEVLLRLGDIYTAQGNYDRAFYMYNHAMPLVEDKNRTRFALGTFYMRKGDASAAINYLKDIVAENPAYPDALRLLADAYFQAGNQSEALSYYLAARKRNGADAHIQGQIALINFEAQDYVTAEREYLKLLSESAQDSRAYFYLAIISLHNRNISKADARLKQAMEQGSPTPEILYQLGQGYEISKKIRKAIEYYNQCLAMESRHEKAQKALADAYVEVREQKHAADNYVKLFALDSIKYADYLAQAGLLYEEANEPAKAREAYARYLSGGYENPEINLHLARLEFRYHMYAKVIALTGNLKNEVREKDQDIRILAESYYKTEDYGNAVEWFRLIVNNKNVDPAVIEMTSSAYEKTGDIATARDYYKKFLPRAEEEKRPDIAYHIAELYETQRMTKDARDQYLDNVALYPSDLRNYDRLIAIYEESGEWSDARKLLEKLVDKPYSKPKYTKTIAQVCLRQNDKINAITHFKEYVKQQPDDFEAWYTIGSLYSERRVFAKAAYALDKAVALDKTHFDAHHLYGVALKEQGKLPEAAKILTRAHAIDQNHVGVVSDLAYCFRRLANTEELTRTLQKLIALDPKHFDAHVELGDILLQTGEVDEGIAILENAWKINKKDVSVHVTLARVYEERNNQNARYSHLKKALGKGSKNLDALYEMGRFYLHEKREKRAERYFKKALDIERDNAAVNYAYGRMLYDMKEYKKAYDLLQTAAFENKYNADYLEGYARASYAVGKKQQALEMTEQALSVDAQHVNALSFAGKLYREKGEPQKAHDMLLRAIAHDQNRPEIYHQLGELALAKEQYTKASGFFKRALEIGGYREESMIGLGRILILTCKDGKARELFEEILSRNNEQREAFYRLTHLYIRGGFIDEAQKLLGKRGDEKKTVWHHLAFGEWAEIEGDYQAARISFTVALRLMGDTPEAYAGLGRVALHQEDYNSAIKNFARAQALDPYNPYLFLNMGKAYEGIGELSSAYNIYTNVAEKFPQIPEAYYRIASIIGRKNQHDQALAIVKEGLQNNPKDGKLYFAMGESYRHLGQFEQAIDAYSEAVRRDGKQCIEGLYHIANIYDEQLRDPKEAKKYLKKYIKAGGDNEEAKRKLNKMANL